MASPAHQIKQTISCKYQNILCERFVSIVPFWVSYYLQFNWHIYIYTCVAPNICNLGGYKILLIIIVRDNKKMLDIKATGSYILRNCIIILGIFLQIIHCLEMRNTCDWHFFWNIVGNFNLQKC